MTGKTQHQLSSEPIYFDWAATAPPDPEILKEAYAIAVENFGNPSSKHPVGKRAAALLEECRRRCATALNCKSEEIVFTSGGSESNNLIAFSLLSQPGNAPEVIISSLEHPSLWEPIQKLSAHGFRIRTLKPDSCGIISAERLHALLTPQTRGVFILGVHNETGVIESIKELSSVVSSFPAKRKIWFHSDLTQAIGKTDVNFHGYGVDSATISAHKIRGMRGVGALLCRGVRNFLHIGGGQEQSRRPGTENLPGIYSLTLALEKMKKDRSHLDYLGAKIFEGLAEIEGCIILPERRLQRPDIYTPEVICATFPPVPGEVLVRTLGQKGVCVSTGAACSSSKKERSRSLLSMGISESLALSAIRISIGGETREEEIDMFFPLLREALHELKAL